MSGVINVLFILLFFSTGSCKSVHPEYVERRPSKIVQRGVTGTPKTPECLNGGSSATENVKSFNGIKCSYNLSDWIWRETVHARMKSLNSTFVTGVRDGTLHPTSFGQYVIQDAIYCLEVSKAFEEAWSRQSDGALKTFLEYEMKLYKSLGDQLTITWHVRNASAIVVGPECQSYIDHHLNVSLNEDPIYTVISSIPCERLWPWLGQELNSQTHHYGPYADWINKNFSPLYTGYKKLEAFVDEAYAKGQVDKDKALQIYLKSMEADAAFFDSIQA